MLRRMIVLGCVGSASLISCGGNEEGEKLVVHRDTPDSVGTAELARKKKMQAITAVGPDGKVEVWDDNDIGFAFLETCRAMRTSLEATGGSLGDLLSSCTALTSGDFPIGLWQWTWEEACQVDIATRIADGQPANVRWMDVNYSIGAQSSATRAYVAGVWGFTGLWDAASLLTIFPTQLAGCTNKAFVASLLADFYRSASNLYAKATDLKVNVSDAERGTTPVRELAAYRAMSSNSLSRFDATSSLVGGYAAEGEGEFFKFPGGGTGFCTSPRLTPQGETALRILRESAVPPNHILATKEFFAGIGEAEVLTSDLLESSQLVGGSVRARVEEKLGQPIDPNKGLAEYFGLTVADFDEARSYLGHEILAFSRSREQETNDVRYSSLRYASTEVPVTERDPAYYAAVARSAPRMKTLEKTPASVVRFDVQGTGYGVPPSGSIQNCTSPQNPWIPLPTWHYLGISMVGGTAGLRERTQDAIGCVVSNFDTDDNTRRIVAPFVSLAQDLRRGYEGTVEHCNRHMREYEGGPQLQATGINVVNASQGYGYRVVVGEDALHCYTSGAVEGFSCQQREYSEREEWIRFELVPDANGTYTAGAAVDNDYAYAMADSHWYVLKTRQPAQISIWDDGQPYWDVGPGGWESVMGFGPRTPFPPLEEDWSQWGVYTSCRRMPVYRDLENKVVEIFKPNSDWCSEPQTTCVGLGSKDPLPLEDELTADADQYESSWKHYLSLAKEAATQADQLAQQYIDYGIDTSNFTLTEEEKQMAREEKAIADLERVQQLCGTSVDPSALVKALGGALGQYDVGDIFNADSGQQPCNAPGATYDCVNGHRVVNWRKLVDLSSPELEPLDQCLNGGGGLSDQATQDFVHLGDAPLCVPQVAIDQQCGSGRFPPCPDTEVADINGQCASTSTVVYHAPIPAEAGLGFFNTRETVADSSGSSTCADIRLARRTQDGSAIARLAARMRFGLDALRGLAKDASISRQIGAYVGVSMNKRYWGTGRPEEGPNTNNWPCSAAALPPDCVAGDSSSLFCSHWDCSNVEERAYANRRLARGILGAKLSVWNDTMGPLVYEVPVRLYGGVRTSENPSQSGIAVLQPSGELLNVSAYAGTSKVSEGWRIFETATAASSIEQPYAWISVDDSVEHSAAYRWEYNLAIPNKQSSFGFYLRDLTKIDQTLNLNAIPLMADKLWAGFAGQGSKDGCILTALKGELWPQECQAKVGLSPGNSSYAYCEQMGSWGLTYPTDAGWTAANCKRTSNHYQFADHQSAEFDYGLSQEAFLDGLELLCMAQESGGAYDCAKGPPELKRVENLGEMGEYLECVGRKIANKGATAVFTDVPKAVLDPFKKHSSNVYQGASGEVGGALSDIRAALLDVYQCQNTVGHVVRQFGSEMKALEQTFRGFADQKEINGIEFASRTMSEMTACTVAVSNLGGLKTAVESGKIVGAAATCVNSVAQIGLAHRLRDLKGAATDSAKEVAIARFNESFDTKLQVLDGQSTELSKALDRLNTAIGKIVNMRKEAERSFADALWHMSRQAKSTAAVASALSNRKALSKERYQRAELNARKMAYLAKRAIEQRLGIHMDEMLDALPLVAAPASWESSICTSAGVNYGAFEKNMGAKDIAAVADGFIGDYVTKLENVVESYRLVNGFQNGSDTAVVSLKDDVLGVREECEIQSRNLFRNSGSMTGFPYGWSEERLGWYADGCSVTSTTDGLTIPNGNCIAIERTGESIAASGGDQLSGAFEITFGVGSTGASPCTGATGECGWTPDTLIGQRMALRAGSYALSWYEKASSGAPEVVHPVISPLGTQTFTATVAKDQTLNFPGWRKRWVIGALSADGDVVIGFRAGELGTGAYNAGGTVAAPMLEALSDKHAAQGADAIVGFYEATDASGNARVRSCSDLDGSEFRQRWSRGCMNVCPDGYLSDCKDFTRKACYHEITFPITQRSIESGQQLTSSGFASGNFNYRINQLGFSVVGTGVRKCSSTAGQSCYGAGFATYTLEHQGPYLVRNHAGADFRAALREGRIEHARALAAERYLTNPISSTDKTLIESYMRREMAGRPLNGSFVLRIWDDEGLDFSSIEDVQLVLDYGYWTRQK